MVSFYHRDATFSTLISFCCRDATFSTLISFYCRDATFSTLISFYCRDATFSTLISFYCRDATFSTLISFYCLLYFSFVPYFSSRLDFPSPLLSAPGSPRMFTAVIEHFLRWYNFTAVIRHFEVKGSNPVQAWIFFRLSFRNFKSCVYNYDDLPSYSKNIVKPLAISQTIHSVCCEDDYFPKGKFKLFNSLFHSKCPVFPERLFSFPNLFAVRFLWDVCNEDKCCGGCDRAYGRHSRLLACLRSHVLRAYCNFKSKQANSIISLFWATLK